MSKDKANLINQPYLLLEEDLRSIVINLLKDESGMRVWDCSPGKCVEPLKIKGVTLGLAVGDFLFFWNNHYYLGELKLELFRCGAIGGEYYAKKAGSLILDTQIKILLDGPGLLLVVSEPLPTTYNIDVIKGEDKTICNKILEQKLRIPLGNNEVPYEVFIMNQEMFKIYWKSYLKNLSPSRLKRWYFSVKKAKKLVPQSYHELYMKEFLNGTIKDLILEIL